MKWIVFAALTALISGCATSPEGRKQLMIVGDDQMNQMGVQAFTEMKTKTAIDRNPSDNAFVKCVANAVTAALPEKQTWEVVVFDDKEVNAFALPGGKIGVLSGILKVTQTPDQLAAVLGHEVGHVLARHGAERASQQVAEQGVLGGVGALLGGDPNSTKYKLLMTGATGLTQYGIVLPFSRKQEAEADDIGLKLMARAGFDPRQAVALWQNMDKMAGATPPEILSDHPSNANRIADLQSRMGEAMKLYQAAGHHPNCTR